MTIETVIGDVCEATLIPAVHVLVTSVNDSCVWFEPMQELCLAVEKVSLILD